jgi:hypothetical protein
MAKTPCVFLIILLVFLFIGCAPFYRAEVKPPQGFLFTNYKAPLTTNFEHTTNKRDLLKASHKKTSFLRIPIIYMDFAWDDADIELIASRAGIKHVAYVDHEFFNMLGIYSSFQVNVYGYEESMPDISN